MGVVFEARLNWKFSFLCPSVLCRAGASSAGAEGGAADGCNRSVGLLPQTLLLLFSIRWTGGGTHRCMRTNPGRCTRLCFSFASCCAVFVVQLVLPRFLRALPVYMNSLRKSEVLLPGLRSSVHQRLQLRCQVLGLDTCSTVRHFYPQLLPVVSPS